MKSMKVVIEIAKAENGFVLNIDNRLIVSRDKWDFKRSIEDAVENIFTKLTASEDEGNVSQEQEAADGDNN